MLSQVGRVGFRVLGIGVKGKGLKGFWGCRGLGLRAYRGLGS